MINVLLSLFRGVHRFAMAKPTQVTVLFVSLMLYSATGYMYFELAQNPNLTWTDAFWWSIVTMTTVGYGDLFPVTTLGRILVGFPTMLLGVGILGYVLSLVASAMLESKMMGVRGMKEIVLVDHVVICNFGNLEKVQKLIQEIHRDQSTADARIVIVDNALEELPAELQDETIHFVKGDASREATLVQANIGDARAVIIQALPDDPANSDNHNLRIGLTIETLAPEAFTVVECINPENTAFFKKANCDSVVCIASLSGQMIVQELQDPGVGTIVSELTSNTHGKQFYVVDLDAVPGTYGELVARYQQHDSCLLGLRRGDENILLPEPGFALQPDDKAVLISAGRP